MNRENRILTALVCICIGGVLTSCASTRVTGGWRVPSLAQVAPRRVLVLAVLGNARSRRAVEDEVVRELAQAGAEAVPGHRICPDTGDIPPERLAQVLADCDADAALVCRWYRVRQTTLYRPGHAAGSPSADAGQLLARGDARLLGADTLRTLWLGATVAEEAGGFLEAAPSFAKALVNAILRDGALACDNRAALPARTGGGIAACLPNQNALSACLHAER